MNYHQSMKVLFLDLDGVLNTDKKVNNHIVLSQGLEIDPLLVSLLVSFLKKHSPFYVVLISSWRDTFSVKEFQEMFFPLGLKIDDMVRDDLDKDQAIEDWVKNHNCAKVFILDDDTLFPLTHPLNKRQVKTSIYSGLTKRHLEELTKLID